MLLSNLLCYDEQHQQPLTYHLQRNAKYKSSEMRFTGVCLAAAAPAMQLQEGGNHNEGKMQPINEISTAYLSSSQK